MSTPPLPFVRPINSSLAATAAPEILGHIFELACGRYFGPDNVYRKKSSSRLVFAVTKVIIRLVCRRWSDVARGTPGLWASSVIRPSESPESFEAWAPLVQTTSLQFHVILNSQEIQHSLQEPSVGVSRIIEFLSAKAAGCAMLSIATSGHNGCSDFLRGLRLAEFATLERLIITTSGNIPSDREASHAFIGNSRSPPELRVAGFPYHWGRQDHFIGLTTIALCDLGPNVAPSIEELHAVLTVATALERISFEDVQSEGQ
ncbi:hypothetical protein K438DRAFT_1975007 [Mycena galopus ATCC 62051]|nr:hypothetical protein K438DRAFT_1975007 [Mycena galopus ATCC 62051]